MKQSDMLEGLDYLSDSSLKVSRLRHKRVHREKKKEKETREVRDNKNR